jgi:c-di-GMP-binding flagellar brake protein YcgR
MKEKPLFTYEPASDVQRQAYRARVPGLMARDVANQAQYHVHDISALGISLEDPGGALKPGDALVVDIQLKDQPIIVGLRAQVARHHSSVAGLKFTDLSQRQEERLDKLVLEVQKYLISKSKTCGSHIDDEHKT